MWYRYSPNAKGLWCGFLLCWVLSSKVMWVDRQADLLRSMGLLKYLALRMWFSALLFAANLK